MLHNICIIFYEGGFSNSDLQSPRTSRVHPEKYQGPDGESSWPPFSQSSSGLFDQFYTVDLHLKFYLK